MKSKLYYKMLLRDIWICRFIPKYIIKRRKARINKTIRIVNLIINMTCAMTAILAKKDILLNAIRFDVAKGELSMVRYQPLPTYFSESRKGGVILSINQGDNNLQLSEEAREKIMKAFKKNEGFEVILDG